MESKRSKYSLIILTVLCVLLICITSLKDGVMDPLRTCVGYFLIPIQTGVNRVGTGLYNELTNYGKLKSALEENEALKTQVARDSEKWFQVFRIDKGSKDGVAVDMNVIADGGLVGIVTDVGANYATVRAIIDDSSRVGAMSVNADYNCIVAGDLTLYNEGRLKITDISKEAALRDGDQIITSNISTKFLPGILIGYAVDVTMDPDHLTQSGYLIPAADFDNLQEVLVITEVKDTTTGEGQ